MMRKVVVEWIRILLVVTVISTATAQPLQLNVQFSPTNNNHVSPTNIWFYNLGITNPSLVTNLTTFILKANDAPIVSARALGAIGDGTTDDTLALLAAITNASGRNASLDLMNGIYLVTNLNLTVPVTIQNGTIRAKTTYTNSTGFVAINSSNVVFRNLTIDGTNNTLVNLRVNPTYKGLRFENLNSFNASQPSGIEFQSAGIMIHGDTEGKIIGGSISNIQAIANGVIGDDLGTSRGLVFVRQSSEDVPRWTVDNLTVQEIYSTGSSPNEDSDGIVVHRFGDELVPIVFKNNSAFDARKRMYKIMADGVTIDGWKCYSTANGTNFTMYSAVSGYAGNLTVVNGQFEASAYSVGIDILNNQSAMANVVVANNLIGTGTNQLVSATAEGIRVGGSYGTTNVVVSGNTIGTAWAKPLIGIHFMGGVTNYTIVNNTIWGGEEGILDGWRYTGEQTWGTNTYGYIGGNVSLGAASFAGIRLKKTADLVLGPNSSDSALPYSFDNGYLTTVKLNTVYNLHHLGGTLKEIVPPVLVGDGTGTTFSGPFTPQIQAINVTNNGTAAVAVGVLEASANGRAMLYYNDSTSIWGLDSTYSSGGAKTFSISQAGTTWFDINGTVIRPYLSIIPTVGNTYDLGSANPMMRSGYFQTSLSIGRPSFGTGSLIFGHASSANATTIRAPNAVAAVTYDWPADEPAVGEVLAVSAYAGNIATLHWTPGGGSGNFTSVGTTNASLPGILYVHELVATNGITIGSGGTNINIPGIYYGYGGHFSNYVYFPTGLGLTNIGGIPSNNIVAGANINITAGANGQLTIASTASGGSTNYVNNLADTGGSLQALNRFAFFAEGDGWGIDDSAYLSQNAGGTYGVTIETGILYVGTRLYGPGWNMWSDGNHFEEAFINYLTVTNDTTLLGSVTLSGAAIIAQGTTLATDDTYVGTTRAGLNNTGGVTQWDAVYLNSSSQWALADANGSGTYPCRGLVIATVAAAGATTIVSSGTVRNDAWNWTPGGVIYLSTTAGGLTQTKPTTSGDKQQVIGYALDADTIALEIDPNYTTVQ